MMMDPRSLEIVPAENVLRKQAINADTVNIALFNTRKKAAYEIKR